MMPVRFHAAARKELLDAADFYDQERPGLGSDFLDEVERSIEQIRLAPLAARRVQGDVRRWVLDRFPFFILYSLSPATLFILALAHHKRRPFYWRSRH